MYMAFREMKCVLAVAKEKSITKAANILGMSQPAVSKSLINLEKTLGIKLFEKKSGEYLPTESGRLYCEYAEDILYRRKKFEKDLKDLLSYQKGRIVYGITPGRSKTLTPEVVPRIKREFPDIHIELVEANVEDLEDSLRKGLIDVAYFTAENEKKEDKGLYFEQLGSEEIVLTVKKGTDLREHAIRKFGFLYPWIDLSQFRDRTFISLKKNMRLGQITKQILKENNLEPEVMEFTSIDTAQELAIRGYGVCLCSSLGVREYKDVLDIYSFGESPIRWDFVAAFRVGSVMTEPLRFLTQAYKQAAENMKYR